MPGLEQSAREQMTGPPVYLDLEKAEILLVQFQETAKYRGWTLRAVAIMANHIHIVAEVADDPHPRKVLADFKAYGTRALNRKYGKRASETW
jgi:REP element-mobilizing transposase RayT